MVRATRLARLGKYEGAIRILEPEANRYYGSYTYYYLLGTCYLYTRVHGNALAYYKLAREIKMRETSVLLGLGALYLNHGDTDRAVDTYLEVLEIDEHNRLAAKALKIIRRNPGPENISSWVDSGRLHILFPPLPKIPGSRRRIAFGLAIAAALIAVFTSVMLIRGYNIRGNRKTPAEAELQREDLNAPMQLEGSFRYVLSRDQVERYYNEARRLFASYHDESARVNLNRILESNGPEPIKNKARILLAYLDTPGFDSLKDKFSYAEVIKEPILYRDCHVIWRGIASNLEIKQFSTNFDFLVGYDTYRTLEGIVRVDFDFAISVNPERPVEILGRIIPVSTEKGPDIRIQGIALNQAGLLDQNQVKQ